MFSPNGPLGTRLGIRCPSWEMEKWEAGIYKLLQHTADKVWTITLFQLSKEREACFPEQLKWLVLCPTENTENEIIKAKGSHRLAKNRLL